MELIKIFPEIQFSTHINMEFQITNISNDSRDVDENSLFIAYTGFEIDLHQYIKKAYDKGCRHFVVNENYINNNLDDGIFIYSKNLKNDNSKIILRFYDYPDRKLILIGITGTNGKTTTAEIINQSIQKQGFKTAFLGTIKWEIGDKQYQVLNTTPDLIVLVKYLFEAVQQNINYIIMEVASHAISMGRVEGLSFDIAGFTNLTQDHLDYHGTLEDYFHTKTLLFTKILVNSKKKNKKSFINSDDQYGQRLCRLLDKLSINYDTLSLYDKGNINTLNIKLSIMNTQFDLNYHDERIFIKTSLLGKINIQNISMAYAILRFLKFKNEDILNSFQEIIIPGRLEKVISPKGIIFLIDYAHTPDALEKVINVVNDTKQQRAQTIIIFGAGGDRDRSKRPLMAKACQNADIIIVSSDNPRTEDPQEIITDILQGFTKEQKNIYQEIDRIKAIQLAYELAKKDDIIIIAGKGHEDCQIIGKMKIHLSDIEQAQKLCK